jgi:sigma-B regulation protein RsbU (phosphoserine phosphatase)
MAASRAIADLSGKGLPAALYMALTRSLLLAGARRESAPSAVLGKVNDLLQEWASPTCS